MRAELTKDEKGVFRWKTNHAVVPPEWLSNEGMVFDVHLQKQAFDLMAVKFADQYDPSTEALTQFADYSLGRLILDPALGDYDLRQFVEKAKTGWRNL